MHCGKPLCGLRCLACGAVLALFCSASAAAAAGTVSVITTNFYAVQGTNATELRDSVHRARPGGMWDAQTKWDVRYDFRARKTDSGVYVDSVSTRATVAITIPQWCPGADAPLALRHAWARYLQALLVHEAGHKQLAIDTAIQIEKELKALGPQPDHNLLREVAGQRVRQILASARRKEVLYDQNTRHGILQGAHFP